MANFTAHGNLSKSLPGGVADMAGTIKVRTSLHEDVATVRTIIRHPMDTGYQSDPESGKIIPAHYIENVEIYHNDKLVMQCDWSRAISRNPYLSFRFSGAAPGDKLQITWQDNQGESDSAEFKIQ